MSTPPDAAPVPAQAAELGLPDEVGLVARLVRLELLVRRVLEQVTAAAAVSVSDALVLAVIRRSPDHRASPSRICDVLDRSSGGMSLALDRLEGAGLLRRTADEGDRRRVLVELTPEGLAVATRVHADLHAWEEALGLEPARRRTILGALDNLLTLVAPRHP